jgi:hypothetical protein
MTLTGAAILLIVGLLLVFLTLGVLHVVGIVLAVVGAFGLVMALVARSRV